MPSWGATFLHFWFYAHPTPPETMLIHNLRKSFPSDAVVKNLLAKAGDPRDTGLIPGWGRFPGGGNGNPLRYSCLENSMDRGAWWVTVHGATKRRTRLSAHTHTHTHTLHKIKNYSKLTISSVASGPFSLPKILFPSPSSMYPNSVQMSHLKKMLLSWSRVDLQCCVNFYSTKISTVNFYCSDSVMHILFHIFSIMVYHQMVNIVPCAIQ